MDDGTCRECGALIPPKAGRGRPRKSCDSCKPSVSASGPIEPRPCVHCGLIFTPERFRQTRHCSRRCKERAAYERLKQDPEKWDAMIRRHREGARRKPYISRASPLPLRPCDQCGAEYQPRERKSRFCCKSCQGKARYARMKADPEQWARYLAKTRREQHRRKRGHVSTLEDELVSRIEVMLRKRTKRCPLCDVRLINTPYKPASKELDHIIPCAAHGTHSRDNVRIICRSCNAKRPDDGSDLVGQQTGLWAGDLETVVALAEQQQTQRIASRIRREAKTRHNNRGRHLEHAQLRERAALALADYASGNGSSEEIAKRYGYARAESLPFEYWFGKEATRQATIQRRVNTWQPRRADIAFWLYSEGSTAGQVAAALHYPSSRRLRETVREVRQRYGIRKPAWGPS